MSELKILSAARERAFRNIPKLSKEDKSVYFLIDVETKKLLNKLRTDASKVGFLVSKVYFQNKGQFFKPSRFDKKDIQCAQKALGLIHAVDIKDYKPDAYALHKKMILGHYNWKAISDEMFEVLREFADNLVAIKQNKEDVLFSLVGFCWQNRIEIPSYSKLTEIITASFKDYDEALYASLEKNITRGQKESLDDFFDKYGEEYSTKDLKKIEQGHSQRSLNKNARMLEFFKPYFSSLLPLLKNLKLTDEAVKYFGESIAISNARDMKRLGRTSKSCLLHSAFIKDQFYIRNDAAADAIIKVIVGHMNAAKGTQRKKREDGLRKLNEDNKTVVTSAKELKLVLNKILAFTNDKLLSDAEIKERVRQLVLAFFTAENPDFDNTLERVDQSLNNQINQTDFYEALYKKSMIIQRELGALVSQIEFDADSRNQKLLAAITFFKSNPKDIDEDSPIEFLSTTDKASLLKEDGFLKRNKFRVLFLLALCKGLKERSVTIHHSYKYRHPAHYMISDEEWANNKLRLVKAVSMDKFLDGEAELNKIGSCVTEAFKQTNERIMSGDNNFFKVKSNNDWYVTDMEADFSVEKIIPKLLTNTKGISLQEIMFETDRHAKFFECFTNRRPKGGNTDVNRKLLFATLMGLGTNLGHVGLARATKMFSEKALTDTDTNWITLKNIEKANDKLVETIQSLPLPAIFNDIKGVLHSSSDGKKVVVNVNSLLANFSYKYYGKEQGVSLNSFLDEKQSFFCVNVLTSSDREAPYMMEGLINTKDILSIEKFDKHLHSTDTHGYTEATFSGLHFNSVSFAPRIKNIGRQALYAFDSASIKENANSPLSPKKQINKKLILEHWDDILRLMVSMKLGRCSASQMLRTLSASERESSLYRALKEFGRLLKTHFILTYVDDEHLRQKINKQLNRVELGQSLADKVFFGRGGKMQVGLHAEILKYASCNTLLRNMIILWNYLYLSDHCLKIKDPYEQKEIIASIASGSVIAWAHINFLGTYDFIDNANSAFLSTFQEMKHLNIPT